MNPSLIDLDVNGIRLRHLEWRSPEPATQRPVVLVHGLSSQGHTWDAIAADLARDRRVIAPDLRGHGDSAWAPDGYHVEKFVADLEATLHLAGIDEVDYVGQSFGGQVGIALAGSRPELVKRLIINDMGPEIAAASVGATRTTVSGADLRGFASVDAAEDHYRQLYPEWRSDFVRSFAEHQLRENWAGKYVLKADPDLFWLLGSAGRKSVPYLWKMAGRITVPVLLLWCRRSEVLDATIVDKLVDMLADGRVHEVDAGHFFPREDPEQFVRLVREFVDTEH